MILARGLFLFVGLFIFTVSIGQNTAPRFALHNTLTISVKQQVCFDVITEDEDEFDTVRISFLGGSIPGQWVTNSGSVRLASGVLCVTPTDQDAGSIWSFVFMAHDGIDSTLDTFYVHVFGYPARHAFNQEELGCGKWRYTAEANSWTILANIRIRDLNSKLVYYRSFNNVVDPIGDTIQLAAGIYVMRTELWDGMPNSKRYFDTIHISRGIEVRVEGGNKANIGETVYLKGKILAGEIPLKTYWVVERNGMAQTMAEDTAYYAQQQFETTTYRFIAQGRDLCLYEDSKTVESVDATGINSPGSASLKPYPNPTRDKIFIETAVESGLLSLYDAKGKEVLTHRFSNQALPELDLISLPSGIYFVKLQDVLGQTWTGKVIKE